MTDPFVDAGWYSQTIDARTPGSNPAVPDVWLGVPCWLDEKREPVYDANGQEVVSTGTINLGLDDAGKLAPGSEVTLPSGPKAIVIAVSVSTLGQPTDGVTAWYR